MFVALKNTISEHDLPRNSFLDIIAGHRMDLRVQRYPTFAALLKYCEKAANPVGRIMLSLLSDNEPEHIRAADDFCTGIQLLDYWQQVGASYDLGRIYIPEEDLLRFGVSEADIRQKRVSKQFKALLAFEISRTRSYFLRGLPLIDFVPKRLRPELQLIAESALCSLDAIERAGYDVYSGKSRMTKLDWARAGASTFVIAYPRELHPGKSERNFVSKIDRKFDGSFVNLPFQSNFAFAFLLLPARRRRALAAAYGFCREVDDAVDVVQDEKEGLSILATWRSELALVYEGAPKTESGRALQAAAKEFNIQRQDLEDILLGVEMDLVHKRYEDFEQLYTYCYRVASAVGMVAIAIFGAPEARVYAEKLGLALQLTNFLRDVREDAGRGRIYLLARRTCTASASHKTMSCTCARDRLTRTSTTSWPSKPIARASISKKHTPPFPTPVVASSPPPKPWARFISLYCALWKPAPLMSSRSAFP